MDFAIIEHQGLLEVERLGDWESYEWERFKAVRCKEESLIKWFNFQDEAIEFMKEHFPKEKINPKYFPCEDLTGEYYIGNGEGY